MQVEGLVQNELAECASRKVFTGKCFVNENKLQKPKEEIQRKTMRASGSVAVQAHCVVHSNYGDRMLLSGLSDKRKSGFW